MKFNLSVELDDQLPRDMQQHFDIGREVVRQDLQAALERTVETYERDVERKKAHPAKNKSRNSGGHNETDNHDPMHPREVKELQSVLTEFVDDCDFFLAEGLEIEEAARHSLVGKIAGRTGARAQAATEKEDTSCPDQPRLGSPARPHARGICSPS